MRADQYCATRIAFPHGVPLCPDRGQEVGQRSDEEERRAFHYRDVVTRRMLEIENFSKIQFARCENKRHFIR